jgi:hypothetical protein
MSEPKESLMKSSACLVVAMCAVLATSAAWAEKAGTRHHHQGRHVTHGAPATTHKQSVPAADSGNSAKPYAHPGDGDNDGLSRDPDDCNKGCIGGNPG